MNNLKSLIGSITIFLLIPITANINNEKEMLVVLAKLKL